MTEVPQFIKLLRFQVGPNGALKYTEAPRTRTLKFDSGSKAKRPVRAQGTGPDSRSPTPEPNAMALLDTENENYTKCYKSYFTEQEIHILSEKQRGKLTQTQDERGRQQACAFIDSLAKKMGL
jgi:hypothetical protein